MAAAWTCPSCAVENNDYRFTCSACGTVRGATAFPGDPNAKGAATLVSPVAPGVITLEQTIEGGLRAYLADPAGLEYATFSVAGAEHVYVQFVLSGGALVGETVAERFLPMDERRRVDAGALERLGFRRDFGGNYAQTWPWPSDVPVVAATAADALRAYRIADDARLVVAHAGGTAAMSDRAPADAAPARIPDGGAPADRPLWRRIAPQVAVIAVIAVVGSIGAWYFNAGRSASGEIAKSGDLPASELRVGDCFDLKDPTAEDVDDVTAIMCADEHEFEVFFAGSLAAGDFPGEAAFPAFVEDECVPAFHSYVGTPYLESELDIFYFVPTPEVWVEGDRSVQCAVYHPLISRLNGTLKGSQR